MNHSRSAELILPQVITWFPFFAVSRQNNGRTTYDESAHGVFTTYKMPTDTIAGDQPRRTLQTKDPRRFSGIRIVIGFQFIVIAKSKPRLDTSLAGEIDTVLDSRARQDIEPNLDLVTLNLAPP